MLKLSSIVNLSLCSVAAIASWSSLTSASLATPQPKLVSARPQSVKVYFPKNPAPPTNWAYVEPVWRQAQTSSVATFAISQVIAGPTRQERQRGFVAPINLQGTSNCGSDFRLSIASNTARLKFCRQVVSAGVGDDARILSSLNTTLKQFSTVQSVIILDRRGNCLGDMSGENRCLQR